MHKEAAIPTPELLLQHGEFIRRLARSLVRDAEDARDLEQEVSIAALDAPAGLRAPRAWLRRVARNLAFTRFRSDSRRREREFAASRIEATVDDVTRLELQKRIAHEVQQLDEPYRAVVILRFFDGLPPRDIAKRLGVPVETVRTRTRRALDRLRGRLDDAHGGKRAAWMPIAVVLAAGAPAKAGLLVAACAAIVTGIGTVTYVNRAVPDEVPVRRASVSVGLSEEVEKPPSTETIPSDQPRVYQGAVHGANNVRVRAVRWERSARTDEQWMNIQPPRGWKTIAELPDGTGPIPVPGSGDWILEFSAPGVATQWLYLRSQRGTPGTLARTMRRAVERRLRFVDSLGIGIRGARVLVGLNGREEWPRLVLTSNSSGWVTWEGAPIESGWVLAPGYVWQAAAGERTVLLPERTFAGRVMDDGEHGIAGARLVISDNWLARSTITGVDGRFRFLGRGGGGCELRVEAEGYAGAARRVRAPDPDVRIHLMRPASLAGRIVRADGSPGDDCDVALRPMSIPHQSWRRQRSGTDGVFRFETLPPGRWELHVKHGWTPVPGSNRKSVRAGKFQLDVDLGPGEAREQFEVRLPLEEVSYLPVRVVDPGGAPRARVQVLGGKRDVLTDTDGRAVILAQAPAGKELYLTARVKGDGPAFARHVARSRASADGEPETIVIHPAGELTIIVRLPDGSPLPAEQPADIGFSPRKRQLRNAGHDRVTRTVWRPESNAGRSVRTLSIRVDGYPELLIPKWTLPGPGTVEIRLVAGLDLTGRFIDSRGRPIVGAVLFGTSLTQRGLHKLATTDEDGSVAARLAGKGEWLFWLRVSATSSIWMKRLDLSAQQDAFDFGETTTGAIRTIAGRVVDARDNPVGGVELRVRSRTMELPRIFYPTGRTGVDGRFNIELPADVPLFVQAWKSGYCAAPLAVTAATLKLELVLHRQSTLKITFPRRRDILFMESVALEDPVTGVRFRALMNGTVWDNWVRPLPPGRFIAIISGDGWEQRHEVELRANETTELNVIPPRR